MTVVRVCKRCGKKWPQHRGSLCRTCYSAMNGHKKQVVIEGDRVTARAAKVANLRRPEVPRPHSTRLIDGVEYDVFEP